MMRIATPTGTAFAPLTGIASQPCSSMMRMRLQEHVVLKPYALFLELGTFVCCMKLNSFYAFSYFLR